MPSIQSFANVFAGQAGRVTLRDDVPVVIAAGNLVERTLHVLGRLRRHSHQILGPLIDGAIELLTLYQLRDVADAMHLVSGNRLGGEKQLARRLSTESGRPANQTFRIVMQI